MGANPVAPSLTPVAPVIKRVSTVNCRAAFNCVSKTPVRSAEPEPAAVDPKISRRSPSDIVEGEEAPELAATVKFLIRVAGMSSSTKALKVGVAAAPVVGPARTVLAD